MGVWVGVGSAARLRGPLRLTTKVKLLNEQNTMTLLNKLESVPDGRFEGYRAYFLPISKSIVLSFGHTKARVLTVDDSTGELQQQALMQFAESLCHALNAGVALGNLQKILENLSAVMDDEFDGLSIGNFTVEGLYVTQHLNVTYVLRDNNSQESDLENEQFMLIVPDHSTEVVDAEQLLRAFHHRYAHESR